MIPQRTQETTYERLRYSVRKGIEAVKAEVSVVDVADLYCGPGGLKRYGGDRWKASCPLPDHDDKTPSFVVYADQGRWWCFGCGRGGDAVDLEMLCGDHAEVWTAMVALSERYGVELPLRPKKWFGWQAEKARRRDKILEARARLYQRRFFRFFRDDLETIEDPAEREEEARKVWKNLESLAWSCAKQTEGRS